MSQSGRVASRKSFEDVYQEAVSAVLRFWSPEMQVEMAAHNVGWRREQTDFERYLRVSGPRYYRAYLALTAVAGARTVCDVGGFWGAFPLALRSLGYEVTMTEALQYYSSTFDKLFDFLRGSGVTVADHDPFQSGQAPPGTFDYLSIMAVVEHYPHSLRPFMESMLTMLAPHGALYIEVPNIAFWPKRIAFLGGRTPLVRIEDIYASAIPFIGHHHEYTAVELRALGELAGLRVERAFFYNYSPDVVLRLWSLLRHPLWHLAFALRPETREVMSMAFRRAEHPEGT